MHNVACIALFCNDWLEFLRGSDREFLLQLLPVLLSLELEESEEESELDNEEESKSDNEEEYESDVEED